MIRRLKVTMITGAILGVVCIIGASLRNTEPLANYYLFAFWFNRFLMGFVFGVMPFSKPLKMLLIRGFIVGLLVSFAFYSATNFLDLTGFLVGGVYGVIIEFVAYKFKKE